MKSTQKGMALVCVLLFLVIFAMLGLYANQSHLLQLKMTNAEARAAQLAQQADYALSLAEKSIDSCEIPIKSDKNILHLAWWQAHAVCIGNLGSMQYYYVQESLGVDECAFVDSQNIAEYRQTTLMAVSAGKQARLVLQSTMIRPVKATQSCTQASRFVTLGRQSWREITY